MSNYARSVLRRLPALVLGGATLAAGVAMALNPKSSDIQKPKATPINLAVDDRPVSRDGKIGASFAPVVKKVAPSVVKVFTSARMKTTSLPEAPGMDNPMLRRFFGDEFGGPNRQRMDRMPAQHGIGSGVVVTKDGYILTNNHVVENADEVKVAMQDGREFTAKIIGRDPKSDVAVIKIEANGLPFLEMADSDKIEVGDIVLAVGNPFGIGQTVTMGMVSAKDRATLGLDYEDFIQTDAAINPGNSGGALVDTEGRLIGINTAILSHSGGNQGIGFAIPTNLAHDVMESLVKDGKVTRGYLGVSIQDVTPALAKQFKLDDQKGALVGDVVPKGPADKAGFKSGDVILAFDGKDVRDSRHLKMQVAHTKPGETVSIKVIRDGSSKTLKATIKELPGSPELAKSDSKSDDNGTLNGVTVDDLNGNVRHQFNIPEEIKGAVVTDVEADSPAYEAGLKPGDVIQEINREPVKGSEDAVRLTENPKDKTSLLKVWSKGGSHYLVVDENKVG